MGPPETAPSVKIPARSRVISSRLRCSLSQAAKEDAEASSRIATGAYRGARPPAELLGNVHALQDGFERLQTDVSTTDDDDHILTLESLAMLQACGEGNASRALDQHMMRLHEELHGIFYLLFRD